MKEMNKEMEKRFLGCFSLRQGEKLSGQDEKLNTPTLKINGSYTSPTQNTNKVQKKKTL